MRLKEVCEANLGRLCEANKALLIAVSCLSKGKVRAPRESWWASIYSTLFK